MGAFDAIPEGWSTFEKHETLWQWRCPWGGVCKKEGVLLFESPNKDQVLDSAALHLCNQDDHAEFTDFYIARDCATEGLPQVTRNTLAYYDEHGEEQQ